MKSFLLYFAMFMQLIGMGMTLFGLYEGIYETTPMSKMTQEMLLAGIGLILFVIGTRIRNSATS